MSDNWIKPGAPVYRVTNPRWGNATYDKRKIAKVYKTGRFILEGDTAPYTQYTPSRIAGEQVAYESRSGYYGSIYRVVPITPETNAARDNSLYDLKTDHMACEIRDHITRNGVDPEKIRAAHAILFPPKVTPDA